MKSLFLSAALLCALTTSGHALLLSFDSGSLTAGSGRPVATSFTVDSAFLETLDDSGDPLKVPVWTPIEPAQIGNPADAGYGPAISGSGALNAEFDQILFTFEAPVFLREFSTILDDSPFGTPGDWKIQFFNAADSLVGEISLDQTQPQFLAELGATPLGSVKKILLPSGAYYDDVTLNVPESGPGMAGLGGLGLLGSWFRRRSGRTSAR